jgi:DNA-binding IclR family transcriptional regulator
MEVFEYFAERHRPAAINEVARALRFPQSSTSFLLHTLADLGYLSYDRDLRVFTPTLRVALLGAWIQSDLLGEEGMVKVMKLLRARTGGTVMLGARNGMHVQYVRVLQPKDEERFYIKPGAKRLLTHSALGRILLSRLPEVEVLKLLRGANLATEDPQARMRPRELLDELERVRRDGYASVETVTPGGASIAMLVPGIEEENPMAVGIGLPIERLRERRVEVAGILSRTLRILVAKDLRPRSP